MAVDMASVAGLWFLLWSFVKLYLIAIPCLLSQILFNTRRPLKIDTPAQEGTVAIVTGGGKGIGFHISRQLARLGVHVIMGVREKDIATQAVSRIKAEIPSAKVEVMELDLSSFASVRQFAVDFLSKNLPLHILINNAGVMLVPRTETQDGLEQHLQVNYLSHYLLTRLLLVRLVSTGRADRHARVVNLSSHVHYVARVNLTDLNSREMYSSHAAYAQSKLALLLFANKLQELLDADSSCVTVNSAHPGVVDTDLFCHTSALTKLLSIPIKWMYKSPEQGSYTPLYLALAPHLDGQGGRYYDNCKQLAPSSRAEDPACRELLWARSETLVGLDR